MYSIPDIRYVYMYSTTLRYSKHIRTYVHILQAVNDLVLSPYENGMVAVASAGGGVSLWSGESQRQLGDFPLAHSSSASRVCFSPYNQMLLASCGTDGKIVFYDISQRKLVESQIGLQHY